MVPNGLLANSNGYNENASRSAYRRSSTNNRDQVMMRPDGRCFVVARSGHNGYHGAVNNSETDEQPVSRTYQYRKVMKPMLERKRRARINRCLDELKEIMLTALQAEGENVSKLEKADILELTVRHLHKLKRQRAFGLALPSHAPSIGNADEPSSNYVDRFRAGFTHCAAEVSQYLASAIQEQQQQQNTTDKTSPADASAATIPPTAVGAFGFGDKFLIDHASSMKLLQHLSYCIQRIETAATCRDESYHRPSANFYSTPPSSPSPNEKMMAGASSPHGSSVWRPW